MAAPESRRRKGTLGINLPRVKVLPFATSRFSAQLVLGLNFLFCAQGREEPGGLHLRGERGPWAHPGCREAAQRLCPVWQGEEGGEGRDPQPLLIPECPGHPSCRGGELQVLHLW